jgi:hypothetical protein
MARNLIVGLLTVMVAVGASWLLFGTQSKVHGTESPPAVVSSDDRVSDLEEEIARLKRELQSVAAKSNVPAKPVGELGAAPPDDDRGKPSAAPQDPDVSMEKGRQAIAAKFTQLSATIAMEQRDPAWADGAEKELRKVVQQLQQSGTKGVTVLNSECKSSLCKVEAAYDSHQAQVQVSDRIRSPIFSGGEVRRYEENGQLRSTAYYYRQGYDRPM